MPNASDLADALSPRLAGTTEGMTLQVLAQIRDSLAAQTRDVRALTEATNEVRERVIRLEERDRRLDHAEADIVEVKAKIDVLMKDKDRRDGAFGALGAIKSWAPFMAMLFSAACVLWLYGRSAGVVPAPPVEPVRIQATGNAENRRIEGTVGGKP